MNGRRRPILAVHLSDNTPSIGWNIERPIPSICRKGNHQFLRPRSIEINQKEIDYVSNKDVLTYEWNEETYM